MRRLPTWTIIGLCALSALIFVLNQVANDYFFYYLYWWFDILMHFLGGFIIGGLTAWGMAAWFQGKTLSFKRQTLIIFIAILVVGIGWEVFEYGIGVYLVEENIVADTALDLVMDVLGAFSAWGLMRRIRYTPLSK